MTRMMTDPTLLYRVEEKLWQKVSQLAVDEYEKIAAAVKDLPEKQAYSEAIRRTGELLNFFPGKYPGGIPNSPSPLAAMLTTGLVGAGLGYGAGAIGEAVMPHTWQRGKLRRTLAMLGGAGGALPGMAWMAANHTIGKPLNAPANPDINPPVNEAPFEGIRRLNTQQAPKNAPIDLPNSMAGEVKMSVLLDDDQPVLYSEAFSKLAAMYGAAGGLGVPAINVNEFNQVVWGDPRVTSRMQPETRAAATGLFSSAAHIGGSNIITPLDIGRITVGMGTGYLSGALVGRALGTLMGMPDETQDHLKNVGMWAGIVSGLVPIAFGG